MKFLFGTETSFLLGTVAGLIDNGEMTWRPIIQNQSQATGRGVPIRRTPELTDICRKASDQEIR